MAFVFGAVIEDSPHCKVFTMTCREGDAAATQLAYDWVTAVTMGSLDAVPEVYFIQDVTSGVVCTGQTEIAIHTPTRTGITFVKTSAAVGVSNIVHTYRVTLLAKRAIEV